MSTLRSQPIRPEELQSLIDKLDAELQREGAVVTIRQPSGADECEFHATSAGYARFGLEFLRASATPQNEFDSATMEQRLDGIIDVDSDINFCWFERHEVLPLPQLPSGRPKPWQTALVFTLVGWLLLTFIIGGITTFQWLGRLLKSWIH